MTLSSKYEMGQKVKTPFGDVGIVKGLWVDDSGTQKVFVQRNLNSDWFKENELEPA